MCKFFLLQDKALFHEWVKLSMKGYYHYCRKNILSAGLIELTNNTILQHKYIPPLECQQQITPLLLTNTPSLIFYHLRIPFDKTPASVQLSNVHPFILGEGRFICMHNGLIEFIKSPPSSKTDSEHFFNRWLHHYKKTNHLESAFEEVKKEIKASSTLNILLYDVQEQKLYVHRSAVKHPLVPPLWVSPTGISNFKVQNSQILPKGKLLVLTTIA